MVWLLRLEVQHYKFQHSDLVNGRTVASMRTAILIGAALIAFWLAYAASPFFAVYDLLRIVQERNLAELSVRVDFPAVRRSLTAQIVRTYLRITGKIGQSGSIVEQFAVAV